MKQVDNQTQFGRALGYILVGCGIIGIIASFALTYDKIQILTNPNYNPNCNISPILSCGSVMKTKQAELLGVPNTIFGLVGFSAIVTLGAALLAKAKFERWLWLGLQLGVSIGFVFTYYLFFEGVYRLQAICPFCFVVWIITAPIFIYTTVYNIQSGNLQFPKQLSTLKEFILRHHGDLLLFWYVLILGILVTHFWYYWKTLI
ncbi:MAG TPA: vitamin K epoxide reductase family protein [Candidatus Dormibacteraeota bacterium]|nr:vitamin K epoxide reductase family protein [Candidatus Dormibacteraeota bacterium]